MYKFVVSEPEKVDFQRICDENPDAEALVVTGGGYNAALLLPERFLNRFNSHDELNVSNEYLNPKWGFTGVTCEQNGRNELVFGAHSHGDLTGWRARPINVASIALIKEQLAEANAFQQQFVVKVHEL